MEFAVKMLYYLKCLHDEGIVDSKWYAFIKYIIFDDYDFSHFWNNLSNVNGWVEH